VLFGGAALAVFNPFTTGNKQNRLLQDNGINNCDLLIKGSEDLLPGERIRAVTSGLFLIIHRLS
jgi:hypothetical protein